MSELTKAILVNSMSNSELYYRAIPRRATAIEMMKVDELWTTNRSDDTKLYSIEAKIGHKAYIGAGENLHEVTQKSKRAIVECAFGEFREYFILIGLALQDYDIVKAKELLYKMEHQMFDLE